MIERNIAECRAAFAQVFGDEIEQVRAMKEAEKEKRKRKKPVKTIPAESTRKSTRLMSKQSAALNGGDMSEVTISSNIGTPDDGETCAAFSGVDVDITENVDECGANHVLDSGTQSQPGGVSSVSSVLGVDNGDGDSVDSSSDYAAQASSANIGKYGCLSCSHSFR